MAIRNKAMKKVVKAAKKIVTKQAVKKAVAAKKLPIPPIVQAKQMSVVADKHARDARAEALSAKGLVKTTAMRELIPLAKEIVVRMDKAAKMEQGAADHRLAAALQLEEARKKCEGAGINFKKWSAEFIPYSYENIRKLVAVGGSADPAKALEDMRLKNKEANQRHREKQGSTPRQEQTEASRDPAPAELPRDGGDGVTVIPGIEHLKGAFDKLRPTDKMQFLTWAAESVGVGLKTDFDE
jgi:hypothetical protein